MTPDLVEWLRAQLDEDERIARAASGEEWGAISPTQPYAVFDVAAYKANTTLRTVGAIAGVEHAEDRAHIAEHDPARVLREIDAKRRLLAVHRPYVAEPDQACLGCAGGIEFERCPVVRLLALPYADRPGYREDWRP